MALRVAICEDLQADREQLLGVLAQSNISTEVSVFHCGEDFLAEFQMRKYDLIFFDIYMDGMTGIETATEVRKLDATVTIAFTTTSLDYALESYRLEAIKYIEKPVSVASIQPILQIVQMQQAYVPKLLVKTKPEEQMVALTDILYLEQSGTRYHVYLVDGSMLVASGKLAALAEQLEGSSFYQCHKSYIVNFSYVKSLDKELQMFEMVKGDNVHIRRDSFWKTKRAYEAFLFSEPKRGATNA